MDQEYYKLRSLKENLIWMIYCLIRFCQFGDLLNIFNLIFYGYLKYNIFGFLEYSKSYDDIVDWCHT